MGCPGSIGWNGVIAIAGNSMPFLTGSFTRSIDLTPSDSLVVDSMPSIYNYTFGKEITKGNFTAEIFKSGAPANAMRTLIGLAIRSSGCSTFGDGTAGGSFIFSPNGEIQQTLSGKAVVNSMNLRGNSGGNVQASFGITTTKITQMTNTLTSNIAFETIGSTENNNPLVYYESSLTTNGTTDDSLISQYLMDWNLSVNSPVTPIFTFCPGVTTAADLRLGLMTVEGDFTYYNPIGQYDNSLNEGANSIVIDLQIGNITMGACELFEDVVPNAGQNDPVFRHVRFKAFGSSGGSSITFA